jgi:hypothetical protein
MNNTRINGRIGALCALLLFAGLAIVAVPRMGISKTATEAYYDCKLEAAVQANNCYMAADSWMDRAICNADWAMNDWACTRALARALGA